eukprot:scaffold15021_cov19-Tisochrysis_lutea.AAC.1
MPHLQQLLLLQQQQLAVADCQQLQCQQVDGLQHKHHTISLTRRPSWPSSAIPCPGSCTWT